MADSEVKEIKSALPAVTNDVAEDIAAAISIASAKTGGKRRAGARNRFSRLPAADEPVTPIAAPEPEPVVAPVAADAPVSFRQSKEEIGRIKTYFTEEIPENVDGFLATLLRSAPSALTTAATATATGLAVTSAALNPGMFSGITDVVGDMIGSIPTASWEEVGASYGTMVESLAGVGGNVVSFLKTPAGVLFIATMIMRKRAADNNKNVFVQLKDDATKLSGKAAGAIKSAALSAVLAVKDAVIRKGAKYGLDVGSRKALGEAPPLPAGGRRRKTKKRVTKKKRTTRRKLFAY